MHAQTDREGHSGSTSLPSVSERTGHGPYRAGCPLSTVHGHVSYVSLDTCPFYMCKADSMDSIRRVGQLHEGATLPSRCSLRD